MPKKRLESIRDKIKGQLYFLKTPVPTRLSSPSHSRLQVGIPSALSEGSPRPSESAEPSSDSQRPPGGTFDIFVDGTGPPQTATNLAGDIAYKGFKALLDVLDRVGYALPPLKAVASALSRVMTVIDVRTVASQWVTVRELTSLMRQNVVQNKADYDAIRQKLEAILSVAQKHRQEGSQRPLDRRVENLAMCVVL